MCNMGITHLYAINLIEKKKKKTRLVRTPETIVPPSADVSAVSCGRVVARCGMWDRVEERLGDFGGEIP